MFEPDDDLDDAAYHEPEPGEEDLPQAGEVGRRTGGDDRQEGAHQASRGGHGQGDRRVSPLTSSIHGRCLLAGVG